MGGIRTALFAWLVARQSGGQFILRIEDTDKQREVEGSEAHIQECLRWLGLEWDEGPGQGDLGPYRQSERLEIYIEWAQKLIDSGRAYADPFSSEEVEAFRRQAKDQKKPFLYRDFRPDNPPAWDGSQPLRLKSEPKAYSWQDEVMGNLSSGPEAIDDFILIKSDGYPTYNFAHIVDDHLMGISHVIRSQEFLPSVPKFLNLYDALDLPWPKFATMPYVLAPAGNKKLSKRDGAKDILDYRKDGYLPEALVNFIATLGWNDGTEQEVFTRDELIEKFSLSRVQRSGARFDEQRLLWMNGHYIRQLSQDELYARLKSSEYNYWGEGQSAPEALKKAVLGLVAERLKYFAELPELTHFFFQEPDTSRVSQLFEEPADKQLKKIDRAEMRRLTEAAAEALRQSDFTPADLADRLNAVLQQNQTKPAVLFPLIRIAITGSKSSPEIFGTLSVLGKEESLKRLDRALALLDA
jgi:glutamyl-tRNA synthetase